MYIFTVYIEAISGVWRSKPTPGVQIAKERKTVLQNWFLFLFYLHDDLFLLFILKCVLFCLPAHTTCVFFNDELCFEMHYNLMA